jgi:hypothetical protein
MKTFTVKLTRIYGGFSIAPGRAWYGHLCDPSKTPFLSVLGFSWGNVSPRLFFIYNWRNTYTNTMYVVYETDSSNTFSQSKLRLHIRFRLDLNRSNIYCVAGLVNTSANRLLEEMNFTCKALSATRSCTKRNLSLCASFEHGKQDSP